MAKIKTTQKAIKKCFSKVIKVPYCGAHCLLQWTSADYYTTRAEGWAADIYDIDGVAIVTGYQPFGGYSIDHKTLHRLERKAMAIWSYRNKWHYNRKKAEVKKLLNKAIEAAK